nr:Chain C, EBV decapeptide epitope [synthetic construct]3DX7_C Chain C, EBV decapeptide epitope [synthetic construct]3DX8_C Chain C, EBV decapeptide epitope [synthetic construct]3DXA_C Chain C, EBV decapeptide epitope [synthetic construct]3DXA_H Chain H, EBV decapeptide epitope [synthetic construct]3DXA_M Chain M, EBV decapeptide epitope [synthetic construct]
EENLLDFVRF